MTVGSRGGVAIAQLLVFVPSAVVAILVCMRHGFAHSTAFYYTLVLCLIRIATAICQLLLQNNPTNGNLVEATAILDSVGITPLLLATLGLLSRLHHWTNARTHGVLTKVHFRIIELIILVGLALAIAGAVKMNIATNGTTQISTLSKVGVILYLVVFVAIIGAWAIAFSKLSVVPDRERRIAWIVLLALPFIGARLVYSVLSIYLHDRTFNAIMGSVPVWVVLAVLEEFIVVILYLLLGLLLERLQPHQKSPLASSSRKHQPDQPVEKSIDSSLQDGYPSSQGRGVSPGQTFTLGYNPPPTSYTSGQ